MEIYQQLGYTASRFRLNLHQSRSQPTEKYQAVIKKGIADRKVVSWLTPSRPKVLTNPLPTANAGNAETTSTVGNIPGSIQTAPTSQDGLRFSGSLSKRMPDHQKYRAELSMARFH
jgi:hypothetical protein